MGAFYLAFPFRPATFARLDSYIRKSNRLSRRELFGQIDINNPIHRVYPINIYIYMYMRVLSQLQCANNIIIAFDHFPTKSTTGNLISVFSFTLLLSGAALVSYSPSPANRH